MISPCQTKDRTFTEQNRSKDNWLIEMLRQDRLREEGFTVTVSLSDSHSEDRFQGFCFGVVLYDYLCAKILAFLMQDLTEVSAA